MENRNKAGRPKSSPNNVAKAAKIELAEAVKPEMKKLGKHIVSGVPFEMRAKLLLEFAKIILPKGEPLTVEGVEIRQIIYEQLKPEFRKIIVYNQRNTPEKANKTFIELYKILSTEQQRDILK